MAINLEELEARFESFFDKETAESFREWMQYHELMKPQTKTYKEFRITVFGKRLFYLYRTKGMGWFRLWNYKGIGWKDVRVHRLYFSERNGLTKTTKIGNWYIYKLK